MAASGSSKMSTFGDKPKKFQIEEDGEFYYIGSEVMTLVQYKMFSSQP